MPNVAVDGLGEALEDGPDVQPCSVGAEVGPLLAFALAYLFDELLGWELFCPFVLGAG